MSLHYLRVITPSKRAPGSFNAQGLLVNAKSKGCAIEAVAREARRFGFSVPFDKVAIRYCHSEPLRDAQVIRLGPTPVDTDDLIESNLVRVALEAA